MLSSTGIRVPQSGTWMLQYRTEMLDRNTDADSISLHKQLWRLLKFYLLLWNYLLFWKMLTDALLRTPFSVIGQCSLVSNSHWLQGQCTIINLSQVASSMILQNHRRRTVKIVSVKIAALGSLKWVTGKAGQCRTYPWPAIPEWPWCRNADAGLT